MYIIFDGTSRLGKVLAIVIRYVAQWNVHQHLVRLEFLAKSMTGKEVAREVLALFLLLMELNHPLSLQLRGTEQVLMV